MNIEETEPTTKSTETFSQSTEDGLMTSVGILCPRQVWARTSCVWPWQEEKKKKVPLQEKNQPPSGFLARSKAGGPTWYPAGTYANNHSLAVCASYVWMKECDG